MTAVSAAAAPRFPIRAALSLAVALVAAVALVVGGRHEPAPRPAGRVPLAQAWPRAARADLTDVLVSPLLFLDATTAVGTLPTRDGAYLRLVVEAHGKALRELRRVRATLDPQFEGLTAAGGRLAWAEVADGRPWQIWTAALAGGQARRLVADAGNAVFEGDQYDLVLAADHVYWTVSSADGRNTEIRSVAEVGGPVDKRPENGPWSLSQWPWLADDAGAGIGITRLQNMQTGRETEVRSSVAEVTACTPAWCRVMVMTAGGDLDHIDMKHPDGSGRRRIAGSGARAAVTDVAVLDRFEILSEPSAYSDITGTAALLVYDIATSRTVTIAAAAGDVFTHDGMLWWATGDVDVVWHTLDLRTV